MKQSDGLEQILDDAFAMGVNHGSGLNNDYPIMRAGMVKKARQWAVSQLPEKKVLKVEEPSLFQGVGGDSAPFFCSACQMSEMKIMDNKEGDKYFCACSYWTDPHNAYLDKSGGKWLGWKDKSKAQEYLNNLPIEENGWNTYADAAKAALEQ